MSELTTPIEINIPGLGTIESADLYLKSEADKVIAELKTRLQNSLPSRTCRKCGKAGTLMLMPIVDQVNKFWNLYNNKGIDYVFGIRCACCGETAFVTKQTNEAQLRHQKYKRCLAMAEMCNARYDKEDAIVNGCWTSWEYISKEMKYWERWRNKWLELADKFKG